MIETQFFILIITIFLVPSRQKHLSSLRDDHFGNPELYDYVQPQEEVPLPAYLDETQHLADIPDPELVQYLNPNDDDSSEPDFIDVGRFPPKKVVLPYVVQLPSGAIRERVPFNHFKRIQPLFLRRLLKNLESPREIQRKPFFLGDSQLPGQTQTKPEQDETSEEIKMTPIILTDSQLPGQIQTKPEQDESSEETQGLPLTLADSQLPGQIQTKPEQDETSGEIQRVPLILTGSQIPGQIQWKPEHNGDFEDTQRDKDGPSEELHKIPPIFPRSKLLRLQRKRLQDTAPAELKREDLIVKLPLDGVLKYLSRKFANAQPRFMLLN